MDCTEFRQLLDTYLEETLDEARRPLFRSHLRECSSCSEWARSEEPSLLFAMAESRPVDLARVEACAVAVTGQIRQQRLAGRLQRNRRPWLAAVAAVAVAVVGAAAWQMLPIAGDALPAVVTRHRDTASRWKRLRRPWRSKWPGTMCGSTNSQMKRTTTQPSTLSSIRRWSSDAVIRKMLSCCARIGAHRGDGVGGRRDGFPGLHLAVSVGCRSDGRRPAAAFGCREA